MSNIILPDSIPATATELSDLTHQKDMLILEAICRTLGHSDWSQEVQDQMKTREYPDGSSVFEFQGKDMLLFEPPLRVHGKMGQPVQFLYDKTDFRYMTPQERYERGLIKDDPDKVENDDDDTE